jgi:hypothetical protein
MYTTEEFRTQVYLWYSENGITVGDPNEGNWERAHIVPRCAGGTETVLLLHGHHCYHDLIQSKEYNRQCFFAGTTRAWLYGEGFLCENWFELVELYEYYSSHHSTQNATARWANLTPEERSALGRRLIETRWANASPEARAAVSSWSKDRWATFTSEERSAQGRRLAEARWATMTPEERSAECGRRRRLGLERKRGLRGLDRELHGALWADDAL